MKLADGSLLRSMFIACVPCCVMNPNPSPPLVLFSSVTTHFTQLIKDNSNTKHDRVLEVKVFEMGGFTIGERM